MATDEKQKVRILPINAAEAVENSLGLFPLFTKKSLTLRWNVSYSLLHIWEVRHDDFPARIKGIMVGEEEGGKRGGPSTSLYPAREVLAYEVERGLTIHDNSNEEMKPWGWRSERR